MGMLTPPPGIRWSAAVVCRSHRAGSHSSQGIRSEEAQATGIQPVKTSGSDLVFQGSAEMKKPESLEEFVMSYQDGEFTTWLIAQLLDEKPMCEEDIQQAMSKVGEMVMRAQLLAAMVARVVRVGWNGSELTFRTVKVHTTATSGSIRHHGCHDFAHSQPQALEAPVRLEDLRGWMKGEDCVVVGCGPSAGADPLMLERCDAHWTISSNRSVTFCAADFAVCVEPYRDKEMWKIIADANPLFVFTHLVTKQDGTKPHPRAVYMSSKDVRTWLFPDVELDDIEGRENRVRLGQCPFYAAAVAILLGFETIGLIGVDYTKDRFPDVAPSNEAWRKLAILAEELGSHIVNLNPDSRLETIPKTTWEEVRTK